MFKENGIAHQLIFVVAVISAILTLIGMTLSCVFLFVPVALNRLYQAFGGKGDPIADCKAKIKEVRDGLDDVIENAEDKKDSAE